MKVFYSLAVMATLFATGCKRVSTVLPTASQDGKDVAACYVNTETETFSGALSANNIYGVKAVTNLIIGSGKSVTIITLVNNNVSIQLYVDSAAPKAGASYFMNTANTYIHINGSYYFADNTNSGITFTRFDDSVIAGQFGFSSTATPGYKLNPITGFFDIKR